MLHASIQVRTKKNPVYSMEEEEEEEEGGLHVWHEVCTTERDSMRSFMYRHT
jgi:hypothetical protein